MRSGSMICWPALSGSLEPLEVHDLRIALIKIMDNAAQHIL